MCTYILYIYVCIQGVQQPGNPGILKELYLPQGKPGKP